MIRRLLSSLPECIKAPLRRVRKVPRLLAFELRYGFSRRRFCPVCGNYSRRFATCGAVPREDAQCLRCRAQERHRLAGLFFRHRTDLYDGVPKRMLHVAPEPCFGARLKAQLGEGYLSADLTNPRAMVQMDVTDIQYPDEWFDVIYCSHVLEHIIDDQQAMRELYRVLRQGGWAVLTVPVYADLSVTHEDASIVTPEGRAAAWGQADHVRRYGPDYFDRLREAGFAVDVVSKGDLADSDDIERMGLTRASGDIYFCRRVSA